jgi:DNA repair exonuclease SbcCD ATPase subunit
MMKQVLLDDKERRVETLRRAFRIQEYSNAASNSAIVDSWARAEIKESSALSKNLLGLKTQLDEENERLRKIESNVTALSERLEKVKSNLENADRELGQMREEREEVIKLQTSISALEVAFRKAKEALAREEKNRESIEAELNEAEEAARIIKDLEPDYRAYIKDKTEFDSLADIASQFEKKVSRKEKLETTIEKAKENLESLIAKIEQIVFEHNQELSADIESISPLKALLPLKAELTQSIRSLPEARVTVRKNEKTIVELRASRTNLDGRLNEEKHELDDILKIGVGAKCPKCRQKLSEAHIDELKTEYKKKKSIVDEKVSNIETEITTAEGQTATAEKEVKRMEADERKLNKIENQISELSTKSKGIDRSKVKLAKEEQELADAGKKLKNKDFTSAEREELAEIEEFMRQHARDIERYEILEPKIMDAEKKDIRSNYVRNLEITKRKSKLEKELERSRTEIESGKKELDRQDIERKEKKDDYEARKFVIEKITKLEVERVEISNDKDSLLEKVAALDANAKNSQVEIERLKSDILSNESASRRKEFYEQFRIWLDDHFVPAVQDIEKHAMVAINDQFNQEFQKWFNILIES